MQRPKHSAPLITSFADRTSSECARRPRFARAPQLTSSQNGSKEVPQRPSFATVELRMLSEPGTHRFFRPEEIVNPSTASEQIPNRIRGRLDKVSVIHDERDRLVRPAAGVIQDSPLGSVEGRVLQRPSARGVRAANRVKHFLAHSLGDLRTRTTGHAFEHPFPRRRISHNEEVGCAIRIEPLTARGQYDLVKVESQPAKK